MKRSSAGDITPLIQCLNYFHPLTSATITYFEKKVVRCTCRKGEMLLYAGTSCKYIYFVKKGLVRGFIKEGRKEITTWITAENELVTSIYSLDSDIPALENIQAIEDCEFLVITSTDLKQLYLHDPAFNINGRKLLQQYYRDAEKRALVIRKTNAVMKYDFFTNHYSHLANRVPLKYVSSFLGITLETLSRVRKKISYQDK